MKGKRLSISGLYPASLTVKNSAVKRRRVKVIRQERSSHHFTKILLASVLIIFAGLSVVGGAIAYTNPELVDFFNAVATAGLNGLKAYFDFLLDLVDKFLPYLV